MAATGTTARRAQNLEIAEVDKRDRAETIRTLKRYNTLLSKHSKEGKELREMVSMSGPRATAKPGEIRPEIYANGAIIRQTSPLTSLPAEVLHRITSHLPLGPNVALSLTCKTLAASADSIRAHAQVLFSNELLAANTARGKPPPKTPSTRVPPHSKPAKLGMLILLKSWFPANQRLCYRCLKYKDRNRQNWTTNAEITRSGLATQKAIDLGPKCPACTDYVALQRGRDLDGYGRLLEGVRRCVK